MTREELLEMLSNCSVLSARGVGHMTPQKAMIILNDPKDRTRDLIIESMQCLIDSGWIWSAKLHDGYRKAALAMIDEGVCHPPEWTEGSIE